MCVCAHTPSLCSAHHQKHVFVINVFHHISSIKVWYSLDLQVNVVCVVDDIDKNRSPQRLASFSFHTEDMSPDAELSGARRSADRGKTRTMAALLLLLQLLGFMSFWSRPQLTLHTDISVYNNLKHETYWQGLSKQCKIHFSRCTFLYFLSCVTQHPEWWVTYRMSHVCFWSFILALLLLQELTSLHSMQQLVLMPPAHLPSPSPFLLSQSPSSHQGGVSSKLWCIVLI